MSDFLPDAPVNPPETARGIDAKAACAALTRLRWASLLEGLSFLALLYCSIVEKRLKGNEDAILFPGMIHGALFLLFCLFLFQAAVECRWKPKRALVGFVCSLLPFAPFWFERSLRREEQRCFGAAA